MLFFSIGQEIIIIYKDYEVGYPDFSMVEPEKFSCPNKAEPGPPPPPLELLLPYDIQSQLLPYLDLQCMITQLGNWQIEQLEYRSSSELMTTKKTASQPNTQIESNGTASLSSKFTNVIYTFHQN